MSAHRVVAIGGSLGSPGPLRRLCASLPAEFAAAVFVVVHTRGEGAELLARNLGTRAALPVGLAADGEPVESGRIYVAPADRHLLVIDGSVRLGRGPRENMARPAIDPLFRSVGVSYGPRAVGVLLTGRLNDGAAGLADLRRCGGVSVVQNPTEAAAPEMPLSALRASDVDHRASVAGMADLLVTLVAEDAPSAPAVPGEIALEVEIALGRAVGSSLVRTLGGDVVALSCPSCGGALSQLRGPPLRFRCQVGHAFTGDVLADEQEDSVDEAIRVALRIVEERANLLEKIADEARKEGATSRPRLYDDRAKEYRRQADVLRRAVVDGIGTRTVPAAARGPG